MEKLTMTRRHFVETTALGAGLLAVGSGSRLIGQEKTDIAPVVQKVWAQSKEYIMEFAAAMPEDKYGFQPTEEVFSFAGQLLHLAGVNYWIFSSLKTEKPPVAQASLQPEGKSKQEVTALLENSFAYGKDYLDALTENIALSEVKSGQGKIAVWKFLLFGAEHLAHHRGQVVVYLRLNGKIPPQYRSGFFG